MPAPLAKQFERQTGWSIHPVDDPGPLSGCIAELKVNYRAKDAPEICAIADQMRDLDRKPQLANGLSLWISGLQSEEFSFRDFSSDRKGFAETVRKFLLPAEEMICEAKKGTREGLKNAFALLDSFKILCANSLADNP